ncbi:hypothetical protein VP01_2494g1 [Puccinia sorghi]|uniref:Uncharacterized protein n=1 Tax=Puccinia sorghi TaxID=27349 RepID=A0A0L6V7M0_9BASI|nr:hypothetical protein VP01_2494g1 [Puccinia sorghi]
MSIFQIVSEIFQKKHDLWLFPGSARNGPLVILARLNQYQFFLFCCMVNLFLLKVSQFLCLGLCHLPVILKSQNQPIETPRYALVGDIDEETSSWLGPSLGDIGSVSKPLTKETSGRVFAFVFAHSSETRDVQFIFNWENMSLFEIKNYKPSIFFDTPQILFRHQEQNIIPGKIRINKDGLFDVRNEKVSPHIDFSSKGGILADDMAGLGKTLHNIKPPSAIHNYDSSIDNNCKLDERNQKTFPAISSQEKIIDCVKQCEEECNCFGHIQNTDSQ